MNELVSRLRIEANATAASGVVRGFEGDVKRVGAAGVQAKGGLDLAAAGAGNFERRAQGGAMAARLLGTAFAGMGVREVINLMTTATFAAKGFETGLGAVAGGASGARAEMGYIRAEAARLGLDVRLATNSFMGLAGATNGTILQGQQTREIWDSVAISGLAMGRSNEQVGRGLEAISQIASKGVVSMEEIRQQLAEAIPGATNIAARAMGMSTAEFNKMVAAGKLLSDDFLPKFAAQLKTEFGPAVDKYLNSDLGKARQSIAALKTDLFDLENVGGQEFLAGVLAGLHDLDHSLSKDETAQQVRVLARELGELAGTGAKALGLVAEHGQDVVVILGALAGLKVGGMFAEWAAGAGAAAGEVGLLRAAVTGLGGPVAIALGVAAAGFTALALATEEQEQRVRAGSKAQADHNAVVAEADALLKEAGVDTRAWGTATADSINPTEGLTASTRGLADQTFRLADARRQAALEAINENSANLQKDLARVQQAQTGGVSPLARMLYGDQAKPAELPRVKAKVGENVDGTARFGFVDAAQEEARIRGDLLANQRAAMALVFAPPGKDKPAPPPIATGGKSKADRAGNLAKDLQADVIALQAQREALKLGGAALDEWRIKDAGRQAVEKSGLSHKATLTAAEAALAAKIRASAEAAETFTLANERVEKAIGLQRTADLDTQALKRRAEAAAQGEQALEDLQVREAGLDAMRQIGIESLDQLTASDRAEAEAAIAAAEAKERQAIATAKADKVAGTLQDLNKRIALEKQRAVAITGGVAAEVEYARAEAIRQALDQAGTNLTAEQTLAIVEKADALFRVSAANEAADFTKQEAEELRLLQLTNEQRDVEERFLRIKRDLLAQHLQLSKEELDARARAAALAEQGAAENARTIGNLKQSLRDTFIATGHLAFDDVGEYAARTIRAQIYDAIMAEPFSLVINAVVNGTLGKVVGGAGVGLAAGRAMGLGTGNGTADMLVAGLGSAAGTAFAGTAAAGWLGAGVANGVIGLGGSAAMAGGLGTLLSSAAVLGPIAAIAALAAVTLFKPKPSNNGALATFSGDSFSLDGNKRTDETSQMATTAAQAVLEGEALLRQAGITLNTTVQQIDIGTRDATDIVLSNGQALTSAVGNAAAAAEAGLKAVLADASYVSDAQKTLVQSMIAAGAGFDQVAASLQGFQAAQGLATAIDDAILKLTDPQAFDTATLKRAQEARRAEIAAAQQAGYLTADQLAGLNGQLDKLEKLELDDLLAKFGAAVSDATEMLKKGQGFQAGVDSQLLELNNPALFKEQQIRDRIAAQKAEAQPLIDAGVLSAGVLGQLDQLQDLQLGKLFEELAGGVTQAVDVFAEARPRLQQWLDQIGVSASAELSPKAAAAAALQQYQAQLAKARAGDTTALANITSYGDQALSTDRTATSSAQQRLALYNQITSDIAALAGQSGAASPTAALNALAPSLTTLAANSNQQLATAAAAGGQPVVVANLPAMSAMYGSVLGAQTANLVASNDRTRLEVVETLKAMSQANLEAVAGLRASLEGGLGGVAAGLEAVEAAAQAQAEATAGLADQTYQQNALLRVGA